MRAVQSILSKCGPLRITVRDIHTTPSLCSHVSHSSPSEFTPLAVPHRRRPPHGLLFIDKHPPRLPPSSPSF